MRAADLTMSNPLPHRRNRRRTSGTAAAELALILPLLIALSLACVDFGRVVYAYLVVSNAARAGAEYGATHQFTSYTRPFWDSQVERSATDEMAQLPGSEAVSTNIHIETAEDSGGQTLVNVEVTYPFAAILPWPGVPSSFSVWRRVSMRQVR